MQVVSLIVHICAIVLVCSSIRSLKVLSSISCHDLSINADADVRSAQPVLPRFSYLTRRLTKGRSLLRQCRQFTVLPCRWSRRTTFATYSPLYALSATSSTSPFIRTWMSSGMTSSVAMSWLLYTYLAQKIWPNTARRRTSRCLTHFVPAWKFMTDLSGSYSTPALSKQLLLANWKLLFDRTIL